MKKAGIYLSPGDAARRAKEQKRLRARRLGLMLGLLDGNAALLWLAAAGYLHPMAGAVMMALLSGWQGAQLGKEEL